MIRAYARAASAGLSSEDLTSQMPPTPVLLGAALVSSLTYAPFINMIPAFGEELGWRGMLYPTLSELIPERSVGPTLLGPNPLGLVAGFPLMAVGVFCWLRLSSAR